MRSLGSPGDLWHINGCDAKFVPWIEQAHACLYPGIRQSLREAGLLMGAYDITSLGRKVHEEYLALLEYVTDALSNEVASVTYKYKIL